MKTIRLLVLVWLVLIPSTLFAAGSQEAAAEEGAEVYTVRYMVPGNEPEDSPLVDEELNNMMAQAELRLALERVWVPWDAYDQKVNIALSTGEEYDLIASWESIIRSWAVQEGLVALDEYLTEENADVLLDTIPEKAWQYRSVDGKIYGFPVYYRDFAYFNDIVTLQAQYFEKYGYDVESIPRTWDELTPIIEEIILAELEEGNDLRHVDKGGIGFQTQFQRMLDTFPFTITTDALALIHEDGTVESWPESDEFVTLARFWNDWYDRGIVHPDILALPHEQVTNRFDTGQWLFSNGVVVNRDRVRQAVPDAKFHEIQIHPEKPRFRGNKLIRNLNSVPITSARPEAVVRFFNYLYAGQSQYDLFHYGIEGVHWERAGEREWVQLDRGRYDWGDWRTGHVDLVRIAPGTTGALRKFHLTFSEEAIESFIVGFSFNNEPVAAELGAVNAEMEASLLPLRQGVADVDEHYDTMLRSLKAAGLDAVIEEYKRQIGNWWEENK